MQDATQAEGIRRKYESLSPLMDERVRRQWAAAEAMSIGWGGL
ncbi:MAG TPA: ISAzo13 family transposase, partial [Tepidisphaeraceae bacterium]|nr:ISAzo13 family transposase [Tepidisphaeraceae bacterium]